jgi:hypothetical protein
MAHPYALFDTNGQWVGMPTMDGTTPQGELRDLGDQPDGASPAGGAISTVGDMLKFAQACRDTGCSMPSSPGPSWRARCKA